MTPYQKKRREKSDERIRAMKALYETGLFSLAQIGKQQTPPITRQRVHQLLRAK